jgi:hypothetical protein
MKKLDKDSVYGEILHKSIENGNLTNLVIESLEDRVSQDFDKVKVIFNGNEDKLAQKKSSLYNKEGKSFFDRGDVFTNKDIESVLSNNVVSPDLRKEIEKTLSENLDLVRVNHNSFVGDTKEGHKKSIQKIEKNQEIMEQRTLRQQNQNKDKKSLAKNNRPKPKNT